jgi:hypothetical protein
MMRSIAKRHGARCRLCFLYGIIALAVSLLTALNIHVALVHSSSLNKYKNTHQDDITQYMDTKLHPYSLHVFQQKQFTNGTRQRKGTDDSKPAARTMEYATATTPAEQQHVQLLRKAQAAILAQLPYPYNTTSENYRVADNPWEQPDDPNQLLPLVPTHHACDYGKGIYHVQQTDELGGAGTALLQLVMNQVDYARRHQLQPWVHLGSLSKVIYDPVAHTLSGTTLLPEMRVANVTRIQSKWSPRDQRPGMLILNTNTLATTLQFTGTGIWNHYFLPVSDFVPGDTSCRNKTYATMDLYLITPGLHGYSNHATRAWRYEYLPDSIRRPHVPFHTWMTPNRVRGHAIMSKYIHFRPYLHKRAHAANPNCSAPNNACLGLHVRHSDKAAGRRVIAVNEFLPFAIAFLQNGGAHIYVATDSSSVIATIVNEWPEHVAKTIRFVSNQTRSKDQKAVFDMQTHHETNIEALTEILALSYCQFLVHGMSALSEAAIWINLGLHMQSVNLEDPGHLTPAAFGRLVKLSLQGQPLHMLPVPDIAVDDWWYEVKAAEKSAPSSGACDGFDGILHIPTVSRGAEFAVAFFTDVLNQFVYANRYNLKPWVHLSTNVDYIFDIDVHNANFSYEFNVMNGFVPSAAQHEFQVHGSPPFYFPDAPVLEGAALANKTMAVTGHGIWESYFKKGSFIPGDPSCSNLPLITLPEAAISPGLDANAPWSVKTWRRDGVPDKLWKLDGMSSHDFYTDLRQKGANVFRQNFELHSYITNRAHHVNPLDNDERCLAVHVRVGNKKGKYLTKVKADKYLPYIESFVNAGGTSLYLASDSHRAIRWIRQHVSMNITNMIRTQGESVVRCVTDKYPTHTMDSHHRVNAETLVDIVAMSMCSLFLHSYSTVAEAVHYMNFKLHENSVNLEDRERRTLEQFKELAQIVLTSKK